MLLASAIAMRERYEETEFDYEFPRELLTGMRARELVCVGTEGGGSVEVEVSIVDGSEWSEERMKLETGQWFTHESQIELKDNDRLVALPYSQFSFAADANGGVIEPEAGLADVLSADAGLYDV